MVLMANYISFESDFISFLGREPSGPPGVLGQVNSGRPLRSLSMKGRRCAPKVLPKNHLRLIIFDDFLGKRNAFDKMISITEP
jgi:hypothetical protein